MILNKLIVDLPYQTKTDIMKNQKKLSTGVVITYDKNGVIKGVHSPYYSQKESNPVRGSLLRWAVYNLKKLI